MIGQKKNSKCTVCVNATSLIPITISPGQQYGDRVIMLTPYLGRMIPNGDMLINDFFIGNPSCYHDFGFRRILTMFSQLRCKGIYVTVQPLISAATLEFITIWSCWERKAKAPDWMLYGDPTTQECARNIRATAEMQGKKGATLNMTHGFLSYSTKCTPVGIEKTGWLDSETTVQEISTISGKSYNQFNLKRTFADGTGTIYVNFNPMLYLAIEAPVSATVETRILLKVDMKCYTQFRYPGNCMPENVLYKLLTTNDSLIPWTPTKDKTPKKEEEDDDDDDTLT